MIQLHILKASGRLEELEKSITSAFDAAIADIQGVMSLPSVDVVIDDDAGAAIPETGVGGSAPSAHLLYIHIDPDFESIEQVIASEIRSTLAHELHHCARWASRGYGTTFLEALVSEGLADHFDIEVNGKKPRPWNMALMGDELAKIMERAKSEFSNNHYDHSAWFFGSPEKRIPRWAGYSVGFSLVEKYIQKTRRKASELVAQNAEAFLSTTFNDASFT